MDTLGKLTTGEDFGEYRNDVVLDSQSGRCREIPINANYLILYREGVSLDGTAKFTIHWTIQEPQIGTASFITIDGAAFDLRQPGVEVFTLRPWEKELAKVQAFLLSTTNRMINDICEHLMMGSDFMKVPRMIADIADKKAVYAGQGSCIRRLANLQGKLDTICAFEAEYEGFSSRIAQFVRIAEGSKEGLTAAVESILRLFILPGVNQLIYVSPYELVIDLDTSFRIDRRSILEPLFRIHVNDVLDEAREALESDFSLFFNLLEEAKSLSDQLPEYFNSALTVIAGIMVQIEREKEELKKKLEDAQVKVTKTKQEISRATKALNTKRLNEAAALRAVRDIQLEIG